MIREEGQLENTKNNAQMDEQQPRKGRSSSDSEQPNKKKKNKIDTPKGVFKRSHSDIQGRNALAVRKDEDKGESGSFIMKATTKNRKDKESEQTRQHKKTASQPQSKDEKKKKKPAPKEPKKPVIGSPTKEKRTEKLKEKIKESLLFKKKKEKTVHTHPTESAVHLPVESKKPKKRNPRKKKAAPVPKRRTKEKAKSDSEGTKKWSATESFRMRMESEFEELEAEDRKKRVKRGQECTHPALEYHNISKNRYNNVLPNPETRVKLTNKDGAGDYINANYVQGERECTYIACQAPLPNTFDDFWRMIYEQKVYVIMMLTRLKERDRVKAEQYWPSVGPLGRTRIFIPLRRKSQNAETGEHSEAVDDELLKMLNRASNGHDSDTDEKEAKQEKEKEKEAKKSPIREASYGPSTTGDEEQSESSSDDDSLEDKIKTRNRAISIETDWSTGLEEEDEEGGFTDYGVISVRLQKTTQASKKLIIRHFLIKHIEDKVIRKVVQIHYTGWPDFGTPKSTKTFHKLLTCMEMYKKQAPPEANGPIVLHCSAGLGRTGTLIAAHIALERIRLGRVRKSQVDLKQIVGELREQRNGMVQTKEQYLFLNELVREYSEMSLYV